MGQLRAGNVNEGDVVVHHICSTRTEVNVRLVHTIPFLGFDFCWFRISDRVNTLKMTFQHTEP